MDLAFQVFGESEHALRIARLAEGEGAAAASLADRRLCSANRERCTDPTNDSFVPAKTPGRNAADIEIMLLGEWLDRFQAM